MSLTWPEARVLLLGKLAAVFDIALILLLAWLALRLAALAQRRALRRIDQSDDPSQADVGRKARLSTIVGVFTYAARSAIIAMALISLLSALGLNVTPLLTSLGVVGLALSLGAQTLIKDYIFGLIVLIENQYSVGETVTIGGLTGEVERITMRATWLRHENGQLSVIPHGDVRAVTNASRDWGLADASFDLPAEIDLPRAIQTLEQAAQQAVAQENLQDDLLTPPTVQGWSGSQHDGVRLRVCARTRVPLRQAVEAALRRAGAEALEANGFSIKR